MNAILSVSCWGLSRQVSKQGWKVFNSVMFAGAVLSFLWLFAMISSKLHDAVKREDAELLRTYGDKLSPFMRHKRWSEYRFVFVGGLRSSGGSLVEQLLASQCGVLGLGVPHKVVSNTSSCERPKRPNPNYQCVWEENQGEAVTKQFRDYYASRGTVCKHGLLLRGTEFGQCAPALHLTEQDSQKIGDGLAEWRLKLFSDWSTFWLSKGFDLESLGRSGRARIQIPPRVHPLLASNQTRKIEKEAQLAAAQAAKDRLEEQRLRRFNVSQADVDAARLAAANSVLVEYDAANLVRSRLLQSVFGASRTSFIFLLRHPLAVPRCRGFKCDVVSHLEAWLSAHELMEKDLDKLQRYIVVHYEGLRSLELTPLSRRIASIARLTSGKEQKDNKQAELTFVDRSSFPPEPEPEAFSVASSGDKATTWRTPKDQARVDRERKREKEDELEQLGFGNISPRKPAAAKKRVPARPKTAGPSDDNPHAVSEPIRQKIQNSNRLEAHRIRTEHKRDRLAAAMKGEMLPLGPKTGSAKMSARGAKPKPNPRFRGKKAPRPARLQRRLLLEPNSTATRGGADETKRGERHKHQQQNQCAEGTKFPYSVLEIGKYQEEIRWATQFPAELHRPDNKDLLEALQAFSQRLAHFCYSITTLEPIQDCGRSMPRFVWKYRESK